MHTYCELQAMSDGVFIDTASSIIGIRYISLQSSSDGQHV